tara:strand:+ start:763 stop:1422 length:660 start_codon:yes stop_codon:yes gene_type:complete
MNEEIKLLLMSYVDGELNEADSLKAEDMIKSDLEALDFINKLKQANIEINAFYESERNEEIEDKLYQFLEKDILERKLPQSSFMEKIFSFRPLLNYSLTALFFLSVGVFYDDFVPSNQDMKLDLNNTTYEKQVFKKRGIEESTKIKDLLSTTIGEMIEEKSSEAKLQYGVQSYAIYLDDVYFKKRSGFVCYYGTILNNGLSKKISYCASKTDKALIYIN